MGSDKEQIFFSRNFKFTLLILLLISYAPGITFSSIVNPDSYIVLGYLDHLTSVQHYLIDLAHFETIDVQPIRDLSLYLDILIFKYFNLNITVLHNLFVWFLSCLVLRKIFFKNFPSMSIFSINLLIILFSIYPLFSTTLLWGIARKHTLSLFFILLATNEILKNDLRKKSLLKSSFFYFLSILCQPINLLWPSWGIFWLLKNQSSRLKEYILINVPIFLLGFWLNWKYYNVSNVFKLYYHSKLESFVSLPEKIQAFGHYVIQLILPINLTFSYEPGHWQSILGIPVGVLLFYLLFKKIRDVSFFLIWSIYGIGPLLIITNTPKLMLDCYLLVPSIAFFIILIKAFEQFELSVVKRNLIAIFLIFIFCLSNFSESKNWGSYYRFTDEAFKKRPTCTTAINAAIFHFEENEKITPEISQFLESNSCVTIYRKMTTTQLDTLVRLNSQIILYDKGFSFEVKERAIGNMTKASYTAYFYLLALYAKQDQMEKFNEAIEQLKPYIENKSVSFEKIVLRYAYPYCLKNKPNECSRILKKISEKKREIWL